MNKKSILKVAQTYKFMVESAQQPFDVGGPSYSDMADLLLRTENPTAEELQSITPKPKDFANGYYYWDQASARWVRNQAEFDIFWDNYMRQQATRIAQERAAAEAAEMARRGIANAKGRMAIIQAVIASLIAAGLFVYLTYEQIEQIVDDYFNPMPQVDVPPNFELYQPFGGLWNLATTDYLPPPPPDPIAF